MVVFDREDALAPDATSAAATLLEAHLMQVAGIRIAPRLNGTCIGDYFEDLAAVAPSRLNA